ncbi:MAG: type II and III secretion system protein [Candidatus Margulisiibacteriota bacterium]
MKKIFLIIVLLFLLFASLYGESLFSYQNINPFASPIQQALGVSPGTEKSGLKKLIEIEVQVLEIANTELNQTGIDLSINKDVIMANLDLLISNGSAEILAKPRISALEGEEALIQIGDKIPYAVPAGSNTEKWTVNYLDTGVKLKISSEIQKNYIVVQVQPEVSMVSQWKTNQAGSFPIISTRETKTKVKVKNGEPIIIGGLINDHVQETVSSIPILGDLPLIGFLFRNTIKEKIKTDIVFIIIPKIVS